MRRRALRSGMGLCGAGRCPAPDRRPPAHGGRGGCRRQGRGLRTAGPQPNPAEASTGRWGEVPVASRSWPPDGTGLFLFSTQNEFMSQGSAFRRIPFAVCAAGVHSRRPLRDMRSAPGSELFSKQVREERRLRQGRIPRGATRVRGGIPSSGQSGASSAGLRAVPPGIRWPETGSRTPAIPARSVRGPCG